MRYSEILKEYKETKGFIHDDYKVWRINVAKMKTPDGKIRGNAHLKKDPSRKIGPIDGSSTEEVMSRLKQMVDDILIGQRRGLEGAKGVVVDFNAPFTRQIFAEVGDVTAARFAKSDGETVLQILDPEWFDEIGNEDGFVRISKRMEGTGEQGGNAAELYHFKPSMTTLKNLGLEANGRYTVEQKPRHRDDPWWEFEIEHHSTAHDKSERMNLPGPGFNVAVW